MLKTMYTRLYDNYDFQKKMHGLHDGTPDARGFAVGYWGVVAVMFASPVVVATYSAYRIMKKITC